MVQINPPPTAPVAPSGRLTLVSCDAFAERVVVRNGTPSATSLAGCTLHDRGPNYSTPLDQWGVLGPGASLAILSGIAPVAGPGEVVWLARNVWNNTGDEATLIAPDGTSTVVTC